MTSLLEEDGVGSVDLEHVDLDVLRHLDGSITSSRRLVDARVESGAERRSEGAKDRGGHTDF